MTHSRTWLASAAALELPDPKLTGDHFPLPNDQTRVAAADQGLDGDGPAQHGCPQDRSCGPLVN